MFSIQIQLKSFNLIHTVIHFNIYENEIFWSMIINFCQYRNLSHFYCQTNVINDVLSFKYYRKDGLFICFIAKINMEEKKKKFAHFVKKDSDSFVYSFSCEALKRERGRAAHHQIY